MLLQGDQVRATLVILMKNAPYAQEFTLYMGTPMNADTGENRILIICNVLRMEILMAIIYLSKLHFCTLLLPQHHTDKCINEMTILINTPIVILFPFLQPYLDYSSLQVTWYITAGNKDHNEGDIQVQVDYTSINPFWYFPKTYYTFTRFAGSTSIQFIVIDSTYINDIKHYPEQVVWLTETIITSTADWLIVASHHCIFSAGENGDTDRVLWLRSHILPLLEKYNVALFLNGHDRSLQHIHFEDSLVHHIVSGGAHKSDYLDTNNYVDLLSLGAEGYFRGRLGFVGVTITGSTAIVTCVDEEGKELYQHKITNPRKAH